MIIHQYLSSGLTSVKDCDPRLRFDRAGFLRLTALKSHQRAAGCHSCSRLGLRFSWLALKVHRPRVLRILLEPPLSELELRREPKRCGPIRLLSLGFGSLRLLCRPNPWHRESKRRPRWIAHRAFTPRCSNGVYFSYRLGPTIVRPLPILFLPVRAGEATGGNA